jgi:hypothetical protein
MNATIKYRLVYKSSLLIPEKPRNDGVQAWIIQRVVVDSRDIAISADDVAIFNFDSEASTFQRFLFDGGAIEIDAMMREVFEHEREARKRRPYP